MTTRYGRSLARIDRNDLLRLAKLAADVEAGLFARHPYGAGRYAGRLVCRALCQGAALHYLDERNGVKDFDVWSFYAARDDGPFPYRWRGTADYGPSKFGRYPDDPVVHRTSRRSTRAITERAARRRTGYSPARLFLCSTHPLREGASGKGSRANQPRAACRKGRLARGQPFGMTILICRKVIDREILLSA